MGCFAAWETEGWALSMYIVSNTHRQEISGPPQCVASATVCVCVAPPCFEWERRGRVRRRCRSMGGAHGGCAFSVISILLQCVSVYVTFLPVRPRRDEGHAFRPK